MVPKALILKRLNVAISNVSIFYHYFKFSLFCKSKILSSGKVALFPASRIEDSSLFSVQLEKSQVVRLHCYARFEIMRPCHILYNSFD